MEIKAFNALHNLSDVSIPNWNGLLVGFILITIAICLAKKYRTMNGLLAVQGILLSLMTFVLGAFLKEIHLYLAGTASLAIKGVLIPLMLQHSLKKSNLYRRKDEHFSSMQAGLWIGAITLIAVYVTVPVLNISEVVSGRTLQIGIAGVFLGLWLMIYRDFLYSQVVGLLLMENCLFLTALALTHGMPLIVELGILFDVFVCIIVMGVLLTKVRHLFDSTKIEQLKQLRG